MSFKLLHRIASPIVQKENNPKWNGYKREQDNFLSSNSSVTMLSSYRSSRGVTVARKEHKISSLLSF